MPPSGLSPGEGTHPSPPDQYGSFRASLLYCPKCRQATPTRERLLLVLPAGNLYEYLCMQCGTSTGSKTDKEQAEVRLFIP
ncbi:MAG: cytoplasmic protein [Nitrospirota bacterium]